jgi:hypothetical protein
MSRGYNNLRDRPLMQAAVGATIYNDVVETPGRLVRDQRLTHATIADTVFTGLIFVAIVIFGSLFLSRFWTRPATVSYSATAAKTTTIISVQSNVTSADCPLTDDDCTVPTAVQTSYGNLTLASDTELVVGFLMTYCTTIGPSVDVTDEEATDIFCTDQMIFNGLGGIDAGTVILQGKLAVVTDGGEVVMTEPFSVVGGAGEFANPIGGSATIALNSTSTLFEAVVTVILVN